MVTIAFQDVSLLYLEPEQARIVPSTQGPLEINLSQERITISKTSQMFDLIVEGDTLVVKEK